MPTPYTSPSPLGLIILRSPWREAWVPMPPFSAPAAFKSMLFQVQCKGASPEGRQSQQIIKFILHELNSLHHIHGILMQPGLPGLFPLGSVRAVSQLSKFRAHNECACANSTSSCSWSKGRQRLSFSFILGGKKPEKVTGCWLTCLPKAACKSSPVVWLFYSPSFSNDN